MKESIVVVTGRERFCRTPYAMFISSRNARKFGRIQGGIWANYVQDIAGFQNNMGANFSVHLPIGVSFFKILT